MNRRVHTSEIRSILEEIHPFPCWAARRGHGTFLTFDFGERQLIQARSGPREVGSIHLWVYLSQWVLGGPNFQADWTSPRETVDQTLKHFIGLPLKAINVNPTRIHFGITGQVQITIKPLEDVDATDELFLLYLPGHRVLSSSQDGNLQIGDGRDQ